MKNLLSLVLLDTLILLVMFLAAVSKTVSSVHREILFLRKKSTRAINLFIPNWNMFWSTRLMALR